MSNESTHDDAQSIDQLTNPRAFRDSDAVEYLTETKTLPNADFAAVHGDLADRGGWAVVGVTNDADALLLMDDGSHGWTLPAIPVDDGGDGAARGREAIEGLTGRAIDLVGVERVRRLDYHEEDGDGQVTVHHVVLRTEPVAGEPVATEPTIGCDGSADVGWFDVLPDELEDVVADDARLFL